MKKIYKDTGVIAGLIIFKLLLIEIALVKPKEACDLAKSLILHVL